MYRYIKQQFSFIWSSHPNNNNNDNINAILIVLGLDAAGKTTMLYKLVSNPADYEKIVTTIPTIGFNVETLTLSSSTSSSSSSLPSSSSTPSVKTSTSFLSSLTSSFIASSTPATQLTCWDVGGCDKIRPLWRYYTGPSHALVFVVDSNDVDRISQAYDELMIFLRDETMGHKKPCLIFANKQDLSGALTAKELAIRLRLNEIRDRKWAIHPSCMTIGMGLQEGFRWMHDVLRYGKASEECIATIEASGGFDGTRYIATLSAQESTLAEAPETPSSSTAITTPTQDVGVIVSSSVDITIQSSTIASNSDTSSAVDNQHVPVIIFDPSTVPPQDKDVDIAVLKAQNLEMMKEYRNRFRRYDAIDTWIDTARTDSSSSELLSQVGNATLDRWGHYEHVRTAFELLNLHGINMTGFEAVDFAISNFISKSPRTNGKSFNATMTRFWAHMIAVVMQRAGVIGGSCAAIVSETSVAIEIDTITLNVPSQSFNMMDSPFMKFLVYVKESFSKYEEELISSLILIDLTNGRLFANYYSNSVIFGPTAQQSFVDPDIANLPDLL